MSVGLNGYFQIQIGDFVETIHNSVVEGGYTIMTKLLLGSGYPLTTIKLGSDGTPTNNSFTDLRGTIIGEKEITGHVSSAGSVVFEAYFGYDEGNGDIREIAIYDSVGTMFARRHIASRIKTSAEPMVVRYLITVKEGGIIDGL